MDCANCGNINAYQKRVIFDVKDGMTEYCNRCGDLASVDASIIDVYWPGSPYKSENLTDEMGKPILLTSKSHKAQVMKELDVREAGDRVHGAPVAPSSSWVEGSRDWRRKQFEKDRPKLKKTYKEWIDARRK